VERDLRARWVFLAPSAVISVIAFGEADPPCVMKSQ